MSLILLVGGARSGKSQLALELASRQRASVVFVATAEPLDEEMAERISRHRAQRPSAWRTLEEPLRLAEAIASAEPEECLVIDCLTLWTANALGAYGAEETLARSLEAAALAASRPGSTVVVSNEVGLGIVPEHPLARGYRDLLGQVNAHWAGCAGEVLFVLAGRILRPLGVEQVLAELA